MKEEILKLRKQGKTYNEIIKITGAAKSTVSYHCGPSQKEKSTNRTRALKNKNKQKAVNYKGGQCTKCGYNKCIAALEFHHVNPNEKKFSISKRRGFTFENIKSELDKCIILCSNCHKELHFNLN